jgi:hypothetical protein
MTTIRGWSSRWHEVRQRSRQIWQHYLVDAIFLMFGIK